MSRIIQIYVYLPNEAVDVRRPVQAEQLEGNVYRILDQPYDLDIETWQFVPGDVVVGETIKGDKGPILAAVRKTDIP